MVTTLKHALQRLTHSTPDKMQAELTDKYTHFQALLGNFTRSNKQLDLGLFSDNVIDWYIKDFVQEHMGT